MLAGAVLLVASTCTSVVTTGEPGAVDLVSLAPAALALRVGASGQLTASAWSGDTQVSVPTLAWSSSNTAVATVDSHGLVTAVAVGTATITADAGDVSGAAVVTVTPTEPQGAVIDVYPSVEYQTMTGWEAVAQVGELECPGFPAYRDALLDAAVGDLGLNRIRLELRSGAENPVDGFARFLAGQITEGAFHDSWYQSVNDNSNPQLLNPAGVHWTHIDHTIDNIVAPLRQRLLARGERLYVNLNYVDFGDSPFEHSANPQEYAELILGAFQHIQSKYGWVPDAVEMILEPDNTSNWRANSIGAAIVATGDRLAAAGFHPDFIAPSNSSMTGAVSYFDALIQVPRVREYLTDLSYHRYSGVSSSALAAIGDRSAQFGVRTAMLEHIGSGHDDLHEDLSVAGNSSWQQFTLGYCESNDNGAQYYLVDASNPSAPVVREGSRTRFLKQYFRHVRLGAVRVGAAGGEARLQPLAFRNPDGRVVVIVRASGAGAVQVRGLPAGTYGVSWTTPTQAGTIPDVTIGAQQPISITVPDGVTTLFRR